MQIMTIELSKKEIEALIVCVDLADLELQDDFICAREWQIKTIEDIGGIDYLRKRLESFEKK